MKLRLRPCARNESQPVEGGEKKRKEGRVPPSTPLPLSLLLSLPIPPAAMTESQASLCNTEGSWRKKDGQATDSPSVVDRKTPQKNTAMGEAQENRGNLMRKRRSEERNVAGKRA